MTSPAVPDATVLAADIGGTHMRAALVGGAGDVLLRRAVETPHHSEVPRALTDLIRSVGEASDHVQPSHAVVGLPGQIDYREGKLLWAPHLPEAWPDRLSADELSRAVGLPVEVANDADLAAVGEAYFGSGRGFSDVAYVTISTGIGCGLVYGGRLLHGVRSMAEVGHTVIDWKEWQGGYPATLEDMGSGSGIARLAMEGGLGKRSALEVENEADRGSPDARAIWQAAIAASAVGLVNLIMAFCPEIVVVGGGLGNQPGFFAAIKAMVEQRAEKYLSAAVAPSALGDDAGLAGSARWGQAFRRD